MQIDKQNGGVAFNDEKHCYWDIGNENSTYISVTTMIEKYGQPFDSDFWSSYKALEKLLDATSWKVEKKSLLNTMKFTDDILDAYGINKVTFNNAKQAVLDEWARTNKESCERGTKIHATLENSFYGNNREKTLKKFQVGGKFECKRDYTALDLENGVYPEYLISYNTSDGKLKIAGQIDVLIKQGNDIIIGDWKTNKKIDMKGGFNVKTKSTSKMLYPLNNLEDCNFSHYCLQLSTYAFIIQQLHPEFNIKCLRLYHIDHDGNETMYDVPYLRNEVVRMLNHYKKENIKAKQKARRQKIIY